MSVVAEDPTMTKYLLDQVKALSEALFIWGRYN